jgi:hypothetical protein
MSDLLSFNPAWFKDPWVELTALLGEQEKQKLVGVVLQLQRDVLAAQLKAVDAVQATLAKR